MIEIRYGGRLGNQMIQFLAASILSEKTGMPISNPLKTSIIKYDCDSTLFGRSRQIDMNDEDYFEMIEGGSFDSENFYRLLSYCQDEKYTSLFSKNRIFLNQPAEDEYIEGVFVHVRLDDILGWHSLENEGNRYMPFEYFDKALEKIKFTKGYISSDSIGHETIKRLSEKYGLEIFCDSPENTIRFGSKFSNKILSLGTFSWWIGFLGNQNNVIHPNTEKHVKWHGDIFNVEGWNVGEY